MHYLDTYNYELNIVNKRRCILLNFELCTRTVPTQYGYFRLRGSQNDAKVGSKLLFVVGTVLVL